MIKFLQANWPTLVVLTGIAAFFVLFRNRTTQADALSEIVGDGQPVIVEVLSNT